MQELDDAAEPRRAGSRVLAEGGAEQDQDGPEPLPAGERDVLAEVPDELDGRVCELAVDLHLAGAQRVADQPLDTLAEDPVQTERHAPRLPADATW